MCITDDELEAHTLLRRPGSSRYRILPSIGQTPSTEMKVEEAHVGTLLDGQKDVAESSVNGKRKPSKKYHNNMQKNVKLAGEGGSDVKRKSLDGQKDAAESSVAGKYKSSVKCHDQMQKDIKLAVKGGSSVQQKSPVNHGTKAAQQPEQPLSAVKQEVVLAVKLPSGQRVEHHFRPTDKLIDVLHYVETFVEEDFTNCEFVSADRQMVLTDLNLTLASSGVLSRSVLYLQVPGDV